MLIPSRFWLVRMAAVVVFLCAVVGAAADRLELRSPNDRVAIEVRFTREGEYCELRYGVSFDGSPVVATSRLGIHSGNADWTRDIVWQGAVTRERDEVWRPAYGERSEIRDHFREAVITLQQTTGRKTSLELVVRAYDEGIAFRYQFPERKSGGEYLHITSEPTQFVLPAGTKGWFTPAPQAASELRLIRDFTGICERPLTLQLPNGTFACLAEAAMVNYARMQFVRDETNPDALRCELFGEVDEITPFATPWRVVMVANTPGELLENNFLLLNLNPPNAIADTSWIRPGKIVRDMGLSTATGKAVADFAAVRGCQYILLDAGWYGYEFASEADATRVNVDPGRNPNNDLDLPAVIAHAASRGIGVWLYVNQRALTAQLDEILPLYRKWGVKGVKFGFVHVGSHRWTTWLHEAVKKAAAHRLMVDIHDDYRPTGFSRTYPNLLTQEGVRGNEEFPDATHNATLPFTRFIAGAADYTICYYRQDFGDGRTGRFLTTTSAHQMSLAVIAYSPLQVLFWYDRPTDYRQEPEIEFFEKVPTVWDETRVVQGEIGQFVTVARRSGEAWFVGTITNNKARTLSIPLSFLPAGLSFDARIYADDSSVRTRTKVGITPMKVDTSTVLQAELKGSGGQAIWIRPSRY